MITEPTSQGALVAHAFLDASARRWPDALAISDGAKSHTFSQLATRSRSVAAQLGALSVRPGDLVGMLMTNRIEFGEALFGISRVGATAAPFNFRLSAKELAFQIMDSGVKVIYLESEFEATAVRALDECDAPPKLIFVDRGTPSYFEETTEPPRTDRAVPSNAVKSGDRFLLLYTSGTTGRPKGAVLTHEAFCLQAYARIIAQAIPFGSGSPWLSGLQLFHLGGLASLIPSVMTGGHLITVGAAVRSPRRILEILEEFQVETCSLIPVQWEAVLSEFGANRVKLNLKRVSIGTMASTVDLFERVGKLGAGISLFNSFGQTETSGITSSLSGDEAIHSPGSVGRPVIGTEVRIVDEVLQDVPQGEVGEIVYRGPSVCREYWNNPQATAEAWEGGWFHSGDLARQDAAGLIWIVGRAKDMIISGGENIYPSEVEFALMEHEAVEECAVVGIPHEKWGETPCAMIVLRVAQESIELDALNAFLLERLASYKRPTQYLFVSQLPKNATGKILKFRAAEIALEKLAGNAELKYSIV